MKKMIFSIFALLIAAAPVLNMATMCMWWGGEPDFPSEEEF